MKIQNRFLKRKRQILVVEDDLELSTVIDQVLQDIDPSIAVDWATSAEQATALIERKTETAGERSYDLVLADFLLEGNQSGLDVWKLCQERLPKTPVIVTSALPADRFFEIVGKDAIAPAFLPKPYLLNEFERVIASGLAKSFDK